MSGIEIVFGLVKIPGQLALGECANTFGQVVFEAKAEIGRGLVAGSGFSGCQRHRDLVYDLHGFHISLNTNIVLQSCQGIESESSFIDQAEEKTALGTEVVPGDGTRNGIVRSIAYDSAS